MTATLKEIKSAIREDFKLRRITYKRAAEKLETSSGTVGNMLSNDKRISQTFAKRLSDAFGYDPSFLMYGQGPLYLPGRGTIVTDKSIYDAYVLGGDFKELAKESVLIRRVKHLLLIMNNKVAIEALDAIIKDDEKRYSELVFLLKAEYGYGLPFDMSNPKAVQLYHEIRENMTMLEVESAKELVAAEEEIFSGRMTEVDVVVNRFRTKLEKALKAKREMTKQEINTGNSEDTNH